MIKKFVPLLLLFAVSCDYCEQTNKSKLCFNMIISDALPIQFWLAGEESYNQQISHEEYVDEVCYDHEIKCTEEQHVQFREVFTPDGDYELLVEDVDGNELATLSFVETPPDVILNGNFDTDLSSWDQNAFVGNQTRAWSWVAGRAQATIQDNLIINNNTRVIGQQLINPSLNYKLNLNSYLDASADVVIGLQLILVLYDNSLGVIDEVLLHAFTHTQDNYDVVDHDLLAVDLVGVTAIGFRFALTSTATVDTDVSLDNISLSAEDGLSTMDLFFTPSTEGLCDKPITMKITRPNDINSDNFTEPSEWVNSGGGGNWTVADNTARINFTGSGQDSKDLTKMLGETYGGDIKVRAKFIQSASADLVTLRVTLGAQDIFFTTAGAGTYTQETDLPGSPDFNSIVLEASSASGGTKLFTVVYVAIFIGDRIVMAFTDPILVSTTPQPSQLIQYRSSKNNASIVYTANTPYFNFRVPGRFYNFRNKTEVEAEELSDSVVINTASSLSKQRMLTVGDLPEYMHTKIQLILAHAIAGSVLIKGYEWIMEETYELIERKAPEYPLKAANIYLTRRNYVSRNVM
jgi:hypothetical protein